MCIEQMKCVCKKKGPCHQRISKAVPQPLAVSVIARKCVLVGVVLNGYVQMSNCKLWLNVIIQTTRARRKYFSSCLNNSVVK